MQHRLDRRAVGQVPDAVGEEEVRRMDRGQLGQEGGRNGDRDVTSGRHTALIVHVPADERGVGVVCECAASGLRSSNRSNKLVSPEHLVPDDGILSRDDIVDVRREPLQETGTWAHTHTNTDRIHSVIIIFHFR